MNFRLPILAAAALAAGLACQKKTSSASNCSDGSTASDGCSSSSPSGGSSTSTPPIGVGGNLPSTYKVLYSFPASPPLSTPGFDLLLSGNTLYMTVLNGGSNPCPIAEILLPCGSIISIGTDGSGLKILHNFVDDDGAAPTAGLTLVGTTLFGMAPLGGTDQTGTIFSMGTDGTGFKVLHNFANSATDGGNPHGSLTLVGSTLFGTTPTGGSANLGTIFKIGTDGSDYAVIHNFQGGTSDGGDPEGHLTLADSTLYGITTYGGSGSGLVGDGPIPGGGTIFSIGTDGSDFRVLHNFDVETDGCCSGASLLLAGTTLYGTTDLGPAGHYGGAGSIFSIKTDGSDFTVLQAFASNPSGPSYPTFGTLALSNNTLWGMSSEGGDGPCDTRGCGAIYSIGTDGSGIKTWSFPYGGAKAGEAPEGSLLIDGNTAYGTTQNVPNSGSWGILFSFEVAASTGTVGTGTATGT